MDLSFITAFGHTLPPLFCPQAKRLHCRDPRLVDNYIHLYHKYAKQCHLFQRVKEFENNYSSMTLHEVQTEYEILDDLRCKVTAAAELKC
jgi:hypothetical protein